MIVYLTLEDILDIVQDQRLGPVADVGLLDSAVHRPGSEFMGIEAYPTLPLKAAALLHSLCNDHGLKDGQKRLALLATVAFLRLNNADSRMTQDEAHDLTLEVADSLDELELIARRLQVVQD